MKEVKLGNKDLDFDLLYDNEDALLEAAMRQTMMPKLSETRWTSRVDTLSLLLAHYKSLLNVLENVQSNSKGKPMLLYIMQCYLNLISSLLQ